MPSTEEFIRVLTKQDGTITCLIDTEMLLTLQAQEFNVNLVEDTKIVTLDEAEKFSVSILDSTIVAVPESSVDINQIFLQDADVIVVQLTDSEKAPVQLADVFIGEDDGGPESTSFSYNLDGSVATVLVGGVLTTFTYVDEVLTSLTTPPFRQDFTYNPDGSVDEITVVLL